MSVTSVRKNATAGVQEKAAVVSCAGPAEDTSLSRHGSKSHEPTDSTSSSKDLDTPGLPSHDSQLVSIDDSHDHAISEPPTYLPERPRAFAEPRPKKQKIKTRGKPKPQESQALPGATAVSETIRSPPHNVQHVAISKQSLQIIHIMFPESERVAQDVT
jgi:hypothetical protein